MRGTFKKACVSRGNRNEDTGDSHKGSTTDSCGHTITQPVSVCRCVFWERKINFHFLGCNSCFFLLYTFCLAFFFLKKMKQTNKSLFSVRVNPTMHECIQIINWPGSNFSLVPERRQKPRVHAQITRDCQQAGPSISPGGQGGKACGCTGVSTSVFASTVTCRGVGVKEAERHALLAPHSH